MLLVSSACLSSIYLYDHIHHNCSILSHPHIVSCCCCLDLLAVLLVVLDFDVAVHAVVVVLVVVDFDCSNDFDHLDLDIHHLLDDESYHCYHVQSCHHHDHGKNHHDHEMNHHLDVCRMTLHLLLPHVPLCLHLLSLHSLNHMHYLHFLNNLLLHFLSFFLVSLPF